MKDSEIKNLLKAEKARQKKVVNLIASENYVSNDVLKALGSELINKYAEGYPGKRYYGGNEVADKVEGLCVERALELFDLNAGAQAGKWHVNVQALSGSPSNLAVFLGLVTLGGKIMGMSLADGGHLTHGQKVSATGKLWTPVHFGVDQKTELIDYAALKAQAVAEKPAIIVAGFTAYPRIVDFKQFRDIADACGAILMVDMSHFAGLVAGGVYPSPFAYADVVTTTTHKTLRGPRSALIFVRKDKARLSTKGVPVSFADLIDKAVFPGLQGGPHLNQIAAVAVALKEAATPGFKKYAVQVVKNAQALANELSALGWRVISSGTDSHLVLIDTWMDGVENAAGGRKGGVTGHEASVRLEKEGIIVNKNTIPFDTRPPMDPSGIRLGSAAETTRGKKEKDFRALAQRVDKILRK